MSKGYVYVLTNPAMPGLVKIGMTKGRPELRAAQLSTTGVPEPFEIKGKFLVPDCVQFERIVHQYLEGARVNSGKEFFKASADEVLKTITALHASIISEWLEEFSPNYTICESEAFVDPGHIYFIADELEEDVELVALAMSDLSPDELKPAILRMKEKLFPEDMR